jgi:hypothetical protein
MCVMTDDKGEYLTDSRKYHDCDGDLCCGGTYCWALLSIGEVGKHWFIRRSDKIWKNFDSGAE